MLKMLEMYHVLLFKSLGFWAVCSWYSFRACM